MEKKKRNRLWLIWGTIIAVMILLLWLTIYEYYQAVEGGEEVVETEMIETSAE